jgi:hypothetical protein
VAQFPHDDRQHARRGTPYADAAAGVRMSGVLRVAHRAGNDLRLLPAAIHAGADVIEADVHLRRRRLEIRHGRSLGPVPWLWEPFYLVRDLRLQLADLRAATPPGSTLMLDLKGSSPQLGEQVRQAMAGAEPYLVCSRLWPALEAFASEPDVKVVHSARTRGELRRLTARLRTHHTWGVSLHRELLTAAGVADLRKQAEIVMTWPIDTLEAYDFVVRLGVNAVISNDLAVLAS